MADPVPAVAEAAGRIPTVTVVIPVHNKATLTRQCLNALLAERNLGVRREIVVVDDGSSDLTPELLRAYGGQIRVVRNDPAKGFAGACNAGAAAGTGDHLVFLNNDTIPQPGWLDALVRYVEARPNVAMAGSKLLFPNDTIQHAGVVFGLDRRPHHIYAGFPADHPAVNVSRAYRAVTGACALIRRPVWDEMGGFDTSYVNGWEDVELCLRLGEAGHEIHYVHDSVVYHLESASRNVLSDREKENQRIYRERWQEKIRPDEFDYFHADGLMDVVYPARYPIQLDVDPQLAGVVAGGRERLADRLLHERARQSMILLRNNIVLNVRVQEAELRALHAESRLREAQRQAAAAAPAQQQAQRAPLVGRVESPTKQPGVITDQVIPVVGWAMSTAGIDRVEAIVDDGEVTLLSYGEERPDISHLHPGYPDTEKPGFVGSVDTTKLGAGEHSLEIRMVSKDGKTATLKTTFEVDPTAFGTGRVIMRCDRPAVDAAITRFDRMVISGWAISPHGVTRVAATIDGVPVPNMSYGALRPDIARWYPFYQGVDHSGYNAIFPLDLLADGPHELVIEAEGGDGQIGTLTVPFSIDGSAPAIGEVPHLTARYPEWLAQNEPTPEQLAALARVVNANAALPSFDLIVPVTAGEAPGRNRLVDSIREQAYRSWRMLLAIAEDADEETVAWATGLVEGDSRIGMARIPGATTFAQLANAALGATRADWVAILPADVRLAPQALAEIALDLHADPEADFLYTDEDKVDHAAGVRWDPFFKPDWSPDLLLGRDYLGPAIFLRRTLLLPLGGLATDLPGAEHFDLALRATERSQRVRHLAKMLVSRRRLLDAPASVDAAVEESERIALDRAVARRGLDATVEPGNQPGSWRVRYAIEDAPGVTIVMPSGGKMSFLRPCMEDLVEKTTYPNLHILILDNSHGDEVAALVEECLPRFPNLRRIPIELQPFNYSELINRSLPHIETEYTVMLNDDVTVVTPDWIEAMLEHAQRPEVGVVGPKLLYPDGTIQHAGVVLGPYQGAVHPFKFFDGERPGYFGLPDTVRDYLAVTFACSMMRTDLLQMLGGLDQVNLPIAFNDVDFCLRAVEAGYRNVYTPHAVLIHHESVTKTVIAKPSEIGRLRSRWARFIKHDPYYNPNLARRGEDAGLNLVEAL